MADARTTPGPESEAQAGARPLAVLDIDGVVADVRHRLHHLRASPPDWEAFFGAAGDDPPLPEGLALVETLRGDHDIVWLTGRPERSRATTRRWFAENGLPDGELHMRPDRDRRPARIFKQAELAAIGAGRTVDVVVDDDPEVVTRLRARGWPVMLADWLPYAPALGEAQEGGRT